MRYGSFVKPCSIFPTTPSYIMVLRCSTIRDSLSLSLSSLSPSPHCMGKVSIKGNEKSLSLLQLHCVYVEEIFRFHFCAPRGDPRYTR